jgi:hypothetical protein
VSLPQRADDAATLLLEATEHFLVGDGPVLAEQLAEGLFMVSAEIGRLRKAGAGGEADDMRAVDQAISACVRLARRLSEATRAQAEPGSYADAARIARDLARYLSPAMPEGTRLNVVCPPWPALVRMPANELRQVFATLARRLAGDVKHTPGELALEVVDDKLRSLRRPMVKVFLGHGALTREQAGAAVADVRLEVNACGGSVEPCARRGGGAAVVLSLPSAS